MLLSYVCVVSLSKHTLHWFPFCPFVKNIYTGIGNPKLAFKNENQNEIGMTPGGSLLTVAPENEMSGGKKWCIAHYHQEQKSLDILSEVPENAMCAS